MSNKERGGMRNPFFLKSSFFFHISNDKKQHNASFRDTKSVCKDHIKAECIQKVMEGGFHTSQYGGPKR